VTDVLLTKINSIKILNELQNTLFKGDVYELLYKQLDYMIEFLLYTTAYMKMIPV